jgi:hypothetical protein
MDLIGQTRFEDLSQGSARSSSLEITKEQLKQVKGMSHFGFQKQRRTK